MVKELFTKQTVLFMRETGKTMSCIFQKFLIRNQTDHEGDFKDVTLRDENGNEDIGKLKTGSVCVERDY